MVAITFGDPDYPCAVPAERCLNKQVTSTAFVCHGSLVEECYVNWASTDPEDVEPYSDYVAECQEKRKRAAASP